MTERRLTIGRKIPLRPLIMALLPTTAMLSGCGGGDGGKNGGEPTPVPSVIVIQSGNNQTGVVAQAVAVKPSVVVQDAGGIGVRGVTVTFSIPFGGGSVIEASQVTGANGSATVGDWILGTSVGSHALRASVQGLNPVQFAAQSVAGPADTMVAFSASTQGAPAGTLVPSPPIVTVQDRFGNAVAGVPVTFAVAEGGGFISATSATSNTLGHAGVVSWQLGTALGLNRVIATAPSLTPLVFSATAIVGPPALVTKVAGDSQSAPSGTVLPVNPTIQVRDAVGHPVPGILVLITGHTGTVNTTQFITDTNGMVSVVWRFSGLGQNHLQIGTDCCKVTFTGASLLGPPASLVPFGDHQSGQVGTTLNNPLGMRVEDLGGNPIPGVQVTFVPLPGSGAVTGAVTTSDASGNAFVGSWRLGTTYALDSLKGSTSTGVEGYLVAQTVPGPAAGFVQVAGSDQMGGAGLPLAVTPLVRAVDQFGNTSWYVRVGFTVLSGGGSVQNQQVTTDVDGLANSGSWTLGAVPGPNSLRAFVVGASVETIFNATAFARPAQIVKSAGDLQSATVASTLTVNPQVQILDTQGQPIAGVPVDFSVSAGGGSLTIARDTSDANGLAESGAWTLGTGSGANQLTASVAGVSPIVFTANGLPDVPVDMTILAGASQTQIVGMAVRTRPTVVLRDQFGNPTPGITISFAVTGGGGQVSGPVATTSTTGAAAVGSWVLGASPGQNILTASAGVGGITGNPATFNAVGLVSAYSVDLRPLSSQTPSQTIAFTSARDRIQRMIVGDVPDQSINLPAGFCSPSQPALFNEPVDDIIIFTEIVAIDGPGGILGQAGPCAFRTPSYLPAVGIMRFDVADLNNLEASGLLQAVILHEMQHVIGFGTNWTQRNLIFGAGTADPFFTGTNARAAFNTIGGSSYSGNRVPVENIGGPGTRDGHWRESVLHSELMTGFINSGFNQLSVVTVNAFLDSGYLVNEGAADDMTLGPFPAPGLPSRTRLHLVDDLWQGPQYAIEPDGTLRPLPRR